MSGQEILKKKSPELAVLPKGWIFKADTSENHRVYFQCGTGPGAKTQYSHPTLGPLPRPWIFCLQQVRGAPELVYLDPVANQYRRDDPRYDKAYMEKLNSAASHSKDTMISNTIRRNIPGVTDMYERAEIGTEDIRHAYNVVHTIDAGNGTRGGMNGGVYVVKSKGSPHFLVEKRFTQDILPFAKREIEMLRRCRHGSLTTYCAAFINETSKPSYASVYVEFCDRGSLEDLIKAYSRKREWDIPTAHIPELFIWHAFLGLADGLAYMMGGRSFLGDERNSKFVPKEGWVPILHRDIKPDNILLKSRSTSGDSKYFYCILSDFGLVCEDTYEDKYQKTGYILGTKLWWAPELCFETPTVPKPKKFPAPHRHTLQSDVWSLGATIYNLTDCDRPLVDGIPYRRGAGAHINFGLKPANMNDSPWTECKQSRKLLQAKDYYSDHLREGILFATRFEVKERPNAIELVQGLRNLMVDGGIKATGPRNEYDKLPEWATKVHDYHSKVPIV